jgi:hypothetical protein
MPFSHRELCDLAVDWLKRPASRKGPGCQVAFSEARADWSGETPDAIGFRAGAHDAASVLVEVKTSRNVFLVDRKKPHRLQPEKGMGLYRYFFAQEGLIEIAELPEQWGLIEVTPKGTIKPRHGHILATPLALRAWQHERALWVECSLLTRMLNRVGDVEKMQNWLKESNNINARLVVKNDKLRRENERLSRELFELRNSRGSEETTQGEQSGCSSTVPFCKPAYSPF